MRYLKIRLVHDGETEEDSYGLFNEVLGPLLEHVECDVHIEDEGEASEADASERRGED